MTHTKTFVVIAIATAAACKGKPTAGSGSGSAPPVAPPAAPDASVAAIDAAPVPAIDAAAGSGSGSDATAGHTPAEATAIQWLGALGKRDAHGVVVLTGLPFTARGFIAQACKPATNPGEMTALVGCLVKEDAVISDLAVVAEGHANVSEVKGKPSDEDAAFFKEHTEDLKVLPPNDARVVIAINGDGQFLHFILTVKDGLVTGGIFDGEAAE